MHTAAALVFATSAAVTVAWCGAMPHCGAWMHMPGQGWPGHAGMFIGMWAVMMIAMMLPAFVPMLSRYRRAIPGSSRALVACVTAGYFGVWILLGAVLFPLGVAFASLASTVSEVSAAGPVASALVVLAAGASQFSEWKTRQLACCRHSIDCCRDTEANYRAAWRHGIKLGLRCAYCCAGLTAVLLVIGVMDLLAMALVTIAISAERLTSERSLAARFNGVVLLLMGSWMLVGAAA